ncbi:MAG: hypothetical protein JEZ12_04070 [Desulfobacterium sp.]|nr:hypothetical protein [Desulfobacterium sp.]
MSGYSVRSNVWGKLLLVIPGCWLFLGCHFPAIPGSAGMAKESLGEAETAFFQKQYTRAGRQFQGIYDRSRDPRLKNAAFLGLICTDLMTAENQTAFQGALASLKRWDALDREGAHGGNPALMVGVLEKLIRQNRAEAGLTSQEMKKMTRTHQEEMEQMRSVQKELEGKILWLKSTMETLRHQISELETIDQEFQEKRKPI